MDMSPRADSDADFPDTTPRLVGILPDVIKGILIILWLLISTLGVGLIILALVPFKYLLSGTRARSVLRKWFYGLANRWIYSHNALFSFLHQVEYQISGQEGLRPKGSYLVISNHLSAGDIISIFLIAREKMPFPRFFLKQELLWIPVFGQALWSYEMPVMKRYSRTYLNLHPEMHGKDLDTTRKSCESLRGEPFTIINFVEGTRFTHSKHSRFKSPYRNLLKPRAGGVHMVLSTIGDQLTSVLDVTISYPGLSSPKFWDLAFGRVKKVVVKIDQLPLDGDNAPLPESLKEIEGFQTTRKWLNDLWEKKDALLDQTSSS